MFIGSGEEKGSPSGRRAMFIERVYHSPTDIGPPDGGRAGF